MILQANTITDGTINEHIRAVPGDITINGCLGERFIGCGETGRKITINGIPGNALAAYLEGAEVEVHGNVQDAVGDTMNSGKIIIHGNAGDALGYAMRGGSIYVKQNVGYRTGIHMKEYGQKCPVIVIGGKTGSFLGEYLAGGLIIVLGLYCSEIPTGAFTGSGMHGGRIYIRTNGSLPPLPPQVQVCRAQKTDMDKIADYLAEFSSLFSADKQLIFDSTFYVLTPNNKNPYKQQYTVN